MLYINKRKTPRAIKEIENSLMKDPVYGYDKIKLPEDKAQLRSLFDHGLPKDEVRKALCAEQHGLCAYCMRRIKPVRPVEKGEDYTRIEHFKPLSKYKDTALDYQNFLGVCFGGENDEMDEANESFVGCCDKSRGDQELTINPTDKRQMEAIAYEWTGRIKVREDCGLDADLIRIMQDDIDYRLCLNGEIDKNTKQMKNDTTSQLRTQRLKICDSVKSQFERWDKRLTSDFLAEKIEYLQRQLVNEGEAEPFIGVRLYMYRKKHDKLVRMGK